MPESHHHERCAGTTGEVYLLVSPTSKGAIQGQRENNSSEDWDMPLLTGGLRSPNIKPQVHKAPNGSRTPGQKQILSSAGSHLEQKREHSTNKCCLCVRVSLSAHIHTLTLSHSLSFFYLKLIFRIGEGVLER